jgi:Tfp pilus assembly protein PilO
VTVSARVGLIAGLAALAALIAAAGLLLLILPQRSKGHQLAAQIQQAQTQLISSKAGHVAASPAQATDLFRLTEAMPNSVEMPGILRDLARLAGASDLTLDSVKPSPVVAPGQTYSVVPLVIVVSGKYPALTGFFQRLQQAVRSERGKLQVEGRLFDVDQLALTSTDGKTVSATLNIDAFVYGTSAVAPTAVSSTGTTTSTSTTTTTTSAS